VQEIKCFIKNSSTELAEAIDQHMKNNKLTVHSITNVPYTHSTNRAKAIVVFEKKKGE